MKFNSTNCDKNCFSRGMPCIKFAVGSKQKKVIRLKKPTTADPKIDIQLVNTKHFFHMAQKKEYKSFSQISCVNTSNCECCKTNSNNIQKQCANITSHIAFEDFVIFMKGKLSYTRNKLQKNCRKSIIWRSKFL